MDENMKKCPYCGEEILKKAIKCKHCGEMLKEQHKMNNVKFKKCPICAEMISANDSFCKFCESSLVDTHENYSSKFEQNTSYSEFEYTTKIPEEIRKWNWGAFWATWVWGIFNKSFLTLFVLIPYFGFIWMIVCGIKGNEWAWKNKKWSSIEEFKKSQYRWALITNIIATITILISLVLYLAIFNVGQETYNQENPVSKSTNPTERCKDALGKTNLSHEDIIICGEDLGIYVYANAKNQNEPDGYTIGEEAVKTHEFMGIYIDYNPARSTEQEVENAAIECFNKSNTTTESLNNCVGIKLHWF